MLSKEYPNNAVLINHTPTVVLDIFEETMFHHAYEYKDNLFNKVVTSSNLKVSQCH